MDTPLTATNFAQYLEEERHLDYAERYGGIVGPHRKVDLHCHTTKSDGKKTVDELVADAVAKKLEFVAVTDHDLVNREATAFLMYSGVPSCESVEISARDYETEHSLHVTFYAKMINQRVDDVLTGIRNGRAGKIQSQCEKLAKNGFDISFAELEDYARKHRMSCDCLTNGHIADLAMSKEGNRLHAQRIAGKPFETKHDFIAAFLKDYSEFRDIGWVKVADYEPSMELVGELVRENNAVASIAHPNFSFEKYGGIPAFEARMKKYATMGIHGIEVNPFADESWIAAIKKTADAVGAILTFGSDSHGEEDPRHMGLGGLHAIATKEPLLVQDSMDQFLSVILQEDIVARRAKIATGGVW